LVRIKTEARNILEYLWNFRIDIAALCANWNVKISLLSHLAFARENRKLIPALYILFKNIDGLVGCSTKICICGMFRCQNDVLIPFHPVRKFCNFSRVVLSALFWEISILRVHNGSSVTGDPSEWSILI
jgi:hypothetical protein